VIDDRDGTFPTLDRAYISSICDADGVVLLQQMGDDLQMRIFNKDGSEAESCGNGLRCLAKYIFDQRIPSNHRLWMHDRWVSFFYEQDSVGVHMGAWKDLTLSIQTDRGEVHFVNTGVPHAIQFVPNPAVIDLTTFGPYLRHHPLFQPQGANASVASLLSDGSIRIRTFERGVEAETLACGTGALAAFVIANALFGYKARRQILYPGGALTAQLERGQLTLLGPVVRI